MAGQTEKDGGAKVFFGCGYCSQVFMEKSELQSHIGHWHKGSTYRCIPATMPERMTQLLHQKPSNAITSGIPLSEVARHNTPEDCWIALNGKIYDLTEFAGRHPGGKATILAWAGKDASTFFNGIHQGIRIQQYLRDESCLGEVLSTEDNAYDGLVSDSYWHKLREARIDELRLELQDLVSSHGTTDDAQSPTAKATAQCHFGCGYCPTFFGDQKELEAHIEDYHKGAPYCRMRTTVVEAFKHIGAGTDITPSELARHNSILDCWVAFNGNVYDFTNTLKWKPESRNAILAWAGRDATVMWDRIAGRFPSTSWSEANIRPEQWMGKLGKEPVVPAREALIRELQAELRRLEGPPESIRNKAKEALAARGAEPIPTAVAGSGEEERFPKLKELPRPEGLRQFTRAEVQKQSGPDAKPPLMILHNKVYDLTKLLGNHPGGDDILLSRAGTDATGEFEVFEHSEKARVQRERDLLVGELVPQDRTDWASAGTTGGDEAVEGHSSGAVQLTPAAMMKLWLRMKVPDVMAVAVAYYLYQTLQTRKPLSQFTYSRALRHLHLLMAAGIFGSLGSVHIAARSEGTEKKFYLKLHKQLGLALFGAIIVRFFLRLRSGIPPRFPGHPIMQYIETKSLQVFYGLALALPVSGIAFDYFLYYAPSTTEADEQYNEASAKQAMSAHRVLGKFLEYVFLPFHLGYTTAYHYSKGRGVVRKVSPFI